MKRILIAVAAIALLILSYLAGRHSTATNSERASAARHILYYVDPMHPSYRSDKPGTAPDCGMRLEPVYADSAPQSPSGTDAASPDEVVKISLAQQQLIGIRVVEAARKSGTSRLTVPGRVVPDDTRTYRVTLGADGVVLSTSEASVGSIVKKGQVLATFGSPDFITAESNFIANWIRAPQGKYETASPKQWKDQTLLLAASRLRALGMSDDQVRELVKTQNVTESIEVAAPVDGIVLARSISTGQRVDKGAEFYRIADLNHVWVLASLRESEAEGVRPGAIVKLFLPNQQKTWSARVSDVVPQLDPATRAVQVRLELDNPRLILRPDMFVNVDLEVSLPDALTIPNEALLESGTVTIVYVDHGNGTFEPRPVQTGRLAGGQVEILAGLAPGEKVVVSGTFLLDSESRLRFPQRGPSSPDPSLHAVGTANLPRTAKDLSCGMDVEPAEAVKKGNAVTYQGVTYYFCSRGCRDEFRANPRAHLDGSGLHTESAESVVTGERGSTRD